MNKLKLGLMMLVVLLFGGAMARGNLKRCVKSKRR